MENYTERELGWDDYIENDSPAFVLLAEGDYDFTVTGFERARHPGSQKLPPCNKAVLTIEIEAPEGTASLKHNLFLHQKTEGMLCAFFTAIGQRKKGEKIQMNWSKVIGSKGRCKIGVHTYTKKDGTEGKSNDIKYFYEPEETSAAPQAAQAYTSYTQGQF